MVKRRSIPFASQIKRWLGKSEQVSWVDFLLLIRLRFGTKEPEIVVKTLHAKIGHLDEADGHSCATCHIPAGSMVVS